MTKSLIWVEVRIQDKGRIIPKQPQPMVLLKTTSYKGMEKNTMMKFKINKPGGVTNTNGPVISKPANKEQQRQQLLTKQELNRRRENAKRISIKNLLN